jgi:predicted Zn-dependent protease
MNSKTTFGGVIQLLLAAVSVWFYGPAAQAFDTSGFAPSAEARWTEARSAFHDTWFERADDLFAQVRAESPEFGPAFGYSAVIDAMLYRDVEPNASRALSLAEGSHSGAAQFTRALVAFARGELVDAETYLRLFLESYPNDAYATHILGFTLIDQGRPQEGVEVLQALVLSDPTYYAAYNHLGYGRLALGADAEALEAFTAFLEANRFNPSAHDSLADAMLANGKPEAALAQLARSVLIEPRFAYGWMRIGDIYVESDEPALARIAYERAIASAGKYGSDFTNSIEEKLAGLP